MNKKNWIIFGLFILAGVLFCTVQFGILPAQEAGQIEYQNRQTDALTHDITVAVDYKSSYIGDASNTANLFYNLPMNNVPMTFEIDHTSLTVNYLDTVWNIGEEKARQDMVYNAIAAMATIDNLSQMTFNFVGEQFIFAREQFEMVFGRPLDDLLEKGVWLDRVQKPLYSQEFVEQFFNNIWYKQLTFQQ